ncbi:MAG TPA: EVE domain-containing protein [bacterium]|nr:EVE domain-containing protein [bacterium]
MNHWLAKTEPGSYSIDDLKRDKKTGWSGIRNYQARNYMRDAMKPGDLVLFYHSNAEPPGIAGIARVASKAYPDDTAFDPKDDHYDPKSTKEKPVWMMVDLQFVEKFGRLVSLDELRRHPRLGKMLVLKRGMRLSIQPVEADHFDIIRDLGRDSRPSGG